MGPLGYGGAGELRVKETDRLKAVAKELMILGVSVEEKTDGLVIKGPSNLSGGTVRSYGDHRMAMALTVAAGIAKDPVKIEDYECVAVSYPNFLNDWERVNFQKSL